MTYDIDLYICIDILYVIPLFYNIIILLQKGTETFLILREN